MITTNQIQSIIDDLDYEAKYFTWQIGNPDEDIQQFYHEVIEPELLADENYCKQLAILQHDSYLSWCEAEHGNTYNCYTGNEADGGAKERAEALIEDIYLTECPDNLRKYIDMDKFVEDILTDGRGSLLNHENGEEYEEIVDSITYYIYHA